VRSKMGELVKQVGKVGTEVNHGDWYVVCPRMLIWEVQRTTVNYCRGPLWLGGSVRGSGGIKSVSGGACGGGNVGFLLRDC